MYLKNFIVPVLFFMGFGLSLANAKDFDDVTKKALKQTVNPIDSSAGVAILNSHRDVYFSVGHETKLVTKVQMRIKFYHDTERAFEYATQHIRLYNRGHDYEKISKISGRTYNLVSGKIEETKMKRGAIFEKELNEQIEEVSFTLPAVKKGSIIDFEYTITSPFVWDIDELVFQYGIPLMQATAEIRTPGIALFKKIFKNGDKIEKTVESKTDHRLGMKVNIHKFRVENMPGLKSEKYVDNVKNYRTGVLLELVYIRSANGDHKQFSIKWKDVVKTIAESEDYERKMNIDRFFKDDIDALIKSETDSLEIVKKIFDHVKDQIKWNGFYGKYFQNGIRDAYQDHKGNSADINLSLISMLRYAGIEAYPVAISTRKNLKPLFPTLDQLNYVIAMAEVDNKTYFMDATDTYSKLNLLPIRDYNWKGLLISKENWKLVDLIQPPQSEFFQIVNVAFKPDHSITGSVKKKLTNHYAYFFRNEINSSSEQDFVREKESDLDNIVIADYVSKHVDLNLGSVTEKYTFTYKNAVQTVGDNLFFQPLFFFTEDENPFKSVSRSLPVNFGYPFKDKTLINIKIPEGYTVVSLPKSIQMTLSGGLGEFVYLVSSHGEYISVSLELTMNSSTFDAEKYNELKQFFDHLIQKQMENVVLKKA